MKRIIGVSGGPDSMALLDKEFKKNSDSIIVCHVNYKSRPTSDRDEKIVEDYCKKKNITFKRLVVNDKVLNKYKKFNNFQDKARRIRYDFFKTFASNDDLILIAHNKDDFLETAIMKKDRSDNYIFYGIRKDSNYKGIKVTRPLIDLWKNDLTSYCIDNNVNYGIDETNVIDKYARNKIRNSLKEYSLRKKESLYKKFIKLNKKNIEREQILNSNYIRWEKNKYNCKFLNDLEEINQIDLIYKYVSENIADANISFNKINELRIFLVKTGNESKKFRIRENIFIKKTHQNVSIETI
ncbi:MAG: tRNA lysidine(34) synthetase TilS [Mycoplasmataceae bacterium]|nr:tRNA lysidine(34) synthetase TilS [Mycoplasmataceae bacterium]